MSAGRRLPTKRQFPTNPKLKANISNNPEAADNTAMFGCALNRKNGEPDLNLLMPSKADPFPKNLLPRLDKGVIAGFPVVDMQVTLYDGSYHEVDSSEIAFKIAGTMALQEAIKRAKPILLEPIMKVEIIVPDNFMGEATGDIASRRGQINSINDRSPMNLKVIDARVPLSEMFGYATSVRSLTEGRGTFN